MSDLKEFLEKHQAEAEWNKYYIPTKKLGMFFWERGGAKWCKWEWADNDYYATKRYSFEELKDTAKCESSHDYDENKNNYSARDFLDALACLGEEKVKELIKELKK